MNSTATMKKHDTRTPFKKWSDVNSVYAMASPGNCTQNTQKTCHCLLQHHTTAFTVKFSHIPLVCQGHHLKTCNMASESGGGASGCFPTAAVVLAKLGCMPQCIDQSGLSAIWDACMQTLAKSSSLQRHLQPSLGCQGSRTHQKECMLIDCISYHEGEDESTDRAGIELHMELCQAESKVANLMRHWYYHCRH